MNIRLTRAAVESLTVVPRFEILPLVIKSRGYMIPIPWVLEKRLLA
jgi:hypothetical protein